MKVYKNPLVSRESYFVKQARDILSKRKRRSQKDMSLSLLAENGKYVSVAIMIFL